MALSDIQDLPNPGRDPNMLTAWRNFKKIREYAATPIGPTDGGTGISSYTTGDTLYASATNVLSKLPIGSTGQFLRVSSGVPAWASLTSGDVTTALGYTPAGSTYTVNRGIVSNPTTGGLTVGPYWNASSILWGLARNPVFDFDVVKTSVTGVNMAIGDLGVSALDTGLRIYASSNASPRIYFGDNVAGVSSLNVTLGYSRGLGFFGISLSDAITSFTSPSYCLSPATGRQSWHCIDVGPLFSYIYTFTGTNNDTSLGLYNSSNSAGKNSRIVVVVAGASAGDPFFQWSISGVSNAVIGLDNSDSDKFGAWYSSTPGTSPIWVYDASTTTTTFANGLTVSGTLTGGVANYSGAVSTGALTATTGGFTGILSTTSDIKLTTAGGGLYIKEGANACMGIVTLVAGVAVVSTTKVTANSRIFLTRQTIGGTLGTSVDVTARTAGTSFTITAQGSILDTSSVAWEIKEPA